MRKGLIVWIFLLLSALVLYLFANGTVTLALLAALIAALPASYALFRLSVKHVGLSLSATPDDNRTFILRMKNSGMLPVATVEAAAACVNLRTRERESFTISRGLGPRKTKEIPLEVVPGHAGRYSLTVDSAVVRDPLGIWSKKIEFSEKAGVTVMPEIFDMNIVQAGVTAMPESDSESAKVRGAVSGDMIDIKEYVPGDPVRNIHWKLSEKTGKALVKVLGNPVSDQYLLILDNPTDIAHDPAALDAVASVYASLLHTLVKREIICYAGWTDPETGGFVIRRISDELEATAAADEYMAVPAAMPGAFGGISGRGLVNERFARVVIVGSQIPSNIDAIANGCGVTVLRFGEQGSFTEGSLTVVGFEAATYISDTAGIEI